MKEWKASEKEAQKMTRDGAISVNMVTGEASHVSDRAPEQDYSPSGDSTALARTALHHLDDRRVRKSQKKKRRNRRKAYREGTAANSRPSSRLQFTEEERAAPELQKAIRRDLWSLSHHLLIFHGRRCCSARGPKCQVCGISQDCRQRQEELAERGKER